MYHVESPVDEPPWVAAAADSLANLEVILLLQIETIKTIGTPQI